MQGKASKKVETFEREIDTYILDWADYAYGYAIKMSGSQEQAKDFVQEATVRILQSGKCPITDALGKAYFETTIKNIIIDTRRKEKFSYSVEDMTTLSPAMKSHESNVVKKIALDEKLAEVKEVLNDEEWEIINLYAAGWNQREIAEIMETSTNSISSKITYLRKKVAHLSK